MQTRLKVEKDWSTNNLQVPAGLVCMGSDKEIYERGANVK